MLVYEVFFVVRSVEQVVHNVLDMSQNYTDTNYKPIGIFVTCTVKF